MVSRRTLVCGSSPRDRSSSPTNCSQRSLPKNVDILLSSCGNYENLEKRRNLLALRLCGRFRRSRCEPCPAQTWECTFRGLLQKARLKVAKPARLPSLLSRKQRIFVKFLRKTAKNREINRKTSAYFEIIAGEQLHERRQQNFDDFLVAVRSLRNY